MPYTMKKVDGYEVRSPSSVKAKKTTLRKAKKQIRLLSAIKHGFVPTKNR